MSISRLEKYILEKSIENTKVDKAVKEIDEMRAKIKKNCGPWLAQINGCRHPIFRGVDAQKTTIDKKVRKHRHPLDTQVTIHNRWNDAFESVFGWRPRSEGLFVSGRYAMAADFGTNTYIVFPKGPFEYLWSLRVFDLASIHLGPDQKEAEKFIKDNYVQNSHLCSAITSGSEIMIKCKGYYGIAVMSLNAYYVSKTTKASRPRGKFLFGNEFVRSLYE